MLAPRLGVLAWLVAVVILCAGAPAHAEKPDVLLLPYQGLGKGVSAELTSQATGIVAQELSAMGLKVARADDVAQAEAPKAAAAAKTGPTGDPSAAERAQELIADAKMKMEDSDLPPAIESLKRAIKLVTDNADAVPDLRLVAEAYLQLGVAHFRNADEDQADEALTQAAHFNPTRELDESEYPPIFVRVFQRVRYKVLQRPRAAIEVRAAAGSLVLLDGRNMGRAPLQLTETLPGPHWLRVERPGETPQVKKIVLKAKRPIMVEFAGAEAGEPAAADAVGALGSVGRNAVDKTSLEQLRAAGKRAGAAFVMIGAIHRTDTAFNVYSALISVSDGAVGRLVDVAFDLDMLSAQIEVFKLAEATKKQVTKGALAKPSTEVPFALAPKIDLKDGSKKPSSAPAEQRMLVAVAAPPPILPPKEVAVPEASARAPVAAVAAGGAPPKPPPAVVPKDESDGVPAVAAISTQQVTTVIAPDEPSLPGGGIKWWVWALVGAAVAGGATAGGILLFSGGGPSEVPLKIQW